MAVNAFSPCSFLLAFGIPAVLGGIIPGPILPVLPIVKPIVPLVPRVVPVPIVKPIVPIVPLARPFPIGAMMAAKAKRGMMMNRAMNMNMGFKKFKRERSSALPDVFDKPDSVLFDPYNKYEFPDVSVTKSLWTNKDFMLNGIGPVQGGHRLNVFNDINIEHNFRDADKFVMLANNRRRGAMDMRDVDMNMIDMGAGGPMEVIVVDKPAAGPVQMMDGRMMTDAGMMVDQGMMGADNVVVVDQGAMMGNGGAMGGAMVGAGNSVGAVIASNDKTLSSSHKDDYSYTSIPAGYSRSPMRVKINQIGVNSDENSVHLIAEHSNIAANDRALGNQLQDTMIINEAQLGGHGMAAYDHLPAQGYASIASNDRVITSDYPTPGAY